MTSVSAPPRSALGRMLEPRAIAVVGASANPAKRGHQILRSLRDTGYRHPVYPVHPA
ncbi:MAG: CoA-binding protein, partial [Nocardia sp.]|nr:CoA-binding protein [Nocardia sp.]